MTGEASGHRNGGLDVVFGGSPEPPGGLIPLGWERVNGGFSMKEFSNLYQSKIDEAALLASVRSIWENSRVHAARTVNTAMVLANWLIGRQIVLAQQKGEDRASYGARLLANLSRGLRADFGSGFSVTGLQYMRAFFLAYPALVPVREEGNGMGSCPIESIRSQIQHAVRVELEEAMAWGPGKLHSSLSWIHYRALLKVARQDARDFYEISAIQNGWSGRALERQIESQLFFRLAKSRNLHKNDTVARFVLGKDSQQIFASRYQLHLPTEAELRTELERERDAIERARPARRRGRGSG
jgi:hypothetical protein